MDFSSFLAAGGVERVAIVAAALLVGFWGYKLYIAGLQSDGEHRETFLRSGTGPGIVFMGVGCMLLLFVLFTGGIHLRNAGEAYLAASVEPLTDAGLAATPAPVEEPVWAEPESAAQIVAAEEAASAAQADAAPVEEVAAPVEEVIAEVEAADERAAVEETTVEFASSLELGGQITSLKSKNVTIEWSAPPED